ncbi:MAG: hypothetical protein K1X51_16800, partial [Rhodospirillaceae bacterium]|nr:hypothetical protein [Rhodospirillaceae bacterium]
AFGGYTPEFMLVDPYNGKGAPSLREIEEAAEAEEEAEAARQVTEPSPSHTPEPDALRAAAGSEAPHSDGAA